MWPDTKAKSHAFSEQKKLPKYNHLLLPRTTGFEFILEQCRRTGIHTIYDITSLYHGSIPQDERAFFYNGMPDQIDYTIRKYTVEEASKNADKFLYQTWDKKENELKQFYENGKITEKEYHREIPYTITLIKRVRICSTMYILNCSYI